jgi:hypothetical protein
MWPFCGPSGAGRRSVKATAAGGAQRGRGDLASPGRLAQRLPSTLGMGADPLSSRPRRPGGLLPSSQRGGDGQRGDALAQDEDELVVNPWHTACEVEHLEHHTLFMTHSAEEVQERVGTPDVEVNAVVHVEQNPEAFLRVAALGWPPGLVAFNVLDPIDKVVLTRRQSRGVIANQMIHRRHLALPIEGDARFWQGAEEDAAVTQHAVYLVQCARGILEVFEHVTRNHEIEGVVANLGEVFRTTDVRDGHQVEGCELRVLLAQVSDTEAIDVLNPHPRLHGQWLVERTEFDALSCEPAGQFRALRG